MAPAAVVKSRQDRQGVVKDLPARCVRVGRPDPIDEASRFARVETRYGLNRCGENGKEIAPPLISRAWCANNIRCVPRETALKMWPEASGGHPHIGPLCSHDVAHYTGPVSRSNSKRSVEVPDEEAVCIHECV